MKKIFTLLLSGLLCTALLAGCGSSSEPASTGSDDVSADVKAIQDRGVLRVGVKADVPKFGFKDPKTEEFEGFEIDLAKALAKEILGDESKVEFTAVNAKTRGPLLDNGEIDMVLATFTITEERKKTYNFTDAYFVDHVGLLVKKDAGIKSLADLDGKKIGVAQSSTSKKAVQAEADAKGIKLEFSEFATYPEIKAALDSGRVDCFSVDKSILFGYLDDNTVILDDEFSPQEYGIATKLTNKGLAELVNNKVNDMLDSGEMDTILNNWGLK